MQYMLLIYAEEATWNALPEPVMREAMGAYLAYGEALRKAKAYVDGGRLHDVVDATTVTIKNGKTSVQDGPFAETKEQLGGYFIVEVKDLDEAIQWAARCPGAMHGKVEVRPIWAMD